MILLSALSELNLTPHNKKQRYFNRNSAVSFYIIEVIIRSFVAPPICCTCLFWQSTRGVFLAR